MADLTDSQAAQAVKVIGSNSSGVETNPMNVDAFGSADVGLYGPNGAAITVDNPGTVNNTRIHTATPDTTTATAVLGALNAAVTIEMSGLSGCGLQINTGTLTGTLTPYISVDGGNSWAATTFYDPLATAIVPTITFTNPNTYKIYTIITLGGTSHVKVQVTSYTSGSATALMRASLSSQISITPVGAGGNSANPVNVIVNSGVNAPVYVTERGAPTANTVSISFGAVLNVPAWPQVKVMTSYKVPTGKTFIAIGLQYKTSANTNGTIFSSRKNLWSFATALANPGTPTLTAKTYSGSGLTTVKTYKYKITAVSNVGETLPSPEASITLTGSQNSVFLAWTAVTGASYYNIWRTLQNDVTNTQKFAASVTTTSFTDTIPDSDLQTITVPIANTTGGSINGVSFPSYSFANLVLVETINAITSPLALDIVYKSHIDQYRYISALPQTVAGDATVFAISNTTDAPTGTRIPIVQYLRQYTEIGVSGVVGVGNTPATGSFNIYGYQHYAAISSSNSNQWGTYYFDSPIRFSSEEEIVLSVTSTSKSTTATRNDGILIGYVE